MTTGRPERIATLAAHVPALAIEVARLRQIDDRFAALYREVAHLYAIVVVARITVAGWVIRHAMTRDT